MNDLIKDKLVSDFQSNKELIFDNINGTIKKARLNAFENFLKQGIPHTKLEDWRFTDVSKFIGADYIQNFRQPKREVVFEDIFKCDVPKLDTHLIELQNGWFSHRAKPIEVLEDGIVIGSFSEGLKLYPELFAKHYDKYAGDDRNGLVALNTATANDGVFIYVPDNVVAQKNLQIVNIIHSDKDLIVNQRNLFVVGKNSKVRIVVCDHSMFFNRSFVNSFTEIIAGENSVIEHDKLQNYSNVTGQYTSTDIVQEADSSVTSNTFTLHGGFTRNDVKVNLRGKHSEINLNGLFLMDRKQHVDNTTYIEHDVPECHSNQKYKGIMDDESRGVFNGMILVKKDAQKTQAYQSNKNMLLTDTAQINTKPHLEIYADDVKCTHGATVGQLDPEAMFYLRSRGIGFSEARMLLMYAFAHEIISEIKVAPLKDRIDDLVARRLRGELSRCNNCSIRCI